jgi:hypothetical protein
VDKDIIFDEHNHLKNVINENLKNGIIIMFVLKKDGIFIIYTILESKSIFINDFWKIVEYSLVMSGTNVAIERIFVLSYYLYLYL